MQRQEFDFLVTYLQALLLVAHWLIPQSQNFKAFAPLSRPSSRRSTALAALLQLAVVCFDFDWRVDQLTFDPFIIQGVPLDSPLRELQVWP